MVRQGIRSADIAPCNVCFPKVENTAERNPHLVKKGAALPKKMFPTLTKRYNCVGTNNGTTLKATSVSSKNSRLQVRHFLNNLKKLKNATDEFQVLNFRTYVRWIIVCIQIFVVRELSPYHFYSENQM